MRHSIKVTGEVYQRLEDIRDKRETFSDAIERLLDLHDKMERAMDQLHDLYDKKAKGV